LGCSSETACTEECICDTKFSIDRFCIGGEIWKHILKFAFISFLFTISILSQIEEEPKKVKMEGEITENKLLPLTNETEGCFLGQFFLLKVR
jgi:hypothetical protein